MEWFDTKETKDQTNLSPEQITYLKKPSLTIFGPFNVIVRKHWDFLVGGLLLRIIDRIITTESSFSEGGILLLSLVFLGFYIYFLYFTIKHGRRLAWNRNNWKSFEDFQHSEDRWMPWGVIFFVIVCLYFVASFF